MVASRTEAFCCLMEYMKELEDGKKNPLFKVLSLEATDVLKVSCSYIYSKVGNIPISHAISSLCLELKAGVNCFVM